MNNILFNMLVNSVGIYFNVVGTNMIIKYNGKYYDRKIGFVTLDNVNYEITLFNDVTDIKKESMFDKKTGALTLDYFKKSLNYLIQNGEVCLVLIDIDDFKTINDTFGHDIGDVVLKSVVDEFKKMLGYNDLICRFGGDEFILAINNGNIDEVRNKINNLTEYIRENYTISNILCIALTFSIGLIKYDIDKSYEENFRDVDELMYIVKKHGKNAVASKETHVKVLK